MPLFLRRLPKIDVTGTFKHQKVELRNQGIVPSKAVSEGKQDAIYMYPRAPARSLARSLFLYPALPNRAVVSLLARFLVSV